MFDSEIPEKSSEAYRILHTADWHLGKLLNDKSRDEEHERFLGWLLSVVAQHQVDAIVLAGDVFDSANPPQSAQARYFEFISSLYRTGHCTLVAIAGNHDSAAQLEAPRSALHALKVHVVGSLAEDPESRILCLPDNDTPKVALALLPFLRDRDVRVGKAGQTEDEIRIQMVDGIKQRYDETLAAFISSGVSCPLMATGHLTVRGSQHSASEREIHIGGLGAVDSAMFAKAYCYVALGHLHRPQATDDAGRVRYAGSPITLSFSECTDRKEIRIIDVKDKHVTDYGLPIPVFRKLVRLRTTRAELETTLADFDPESAEFSSWVEVEVEDAAIDDDLNERVAELTRDRPFEVLKVIRKEAVVASGMAVGNATDDEAIQSLLDDPIAVFDRLLKDQELNQDEVDHLRTAFKMLCDQESQTHLGEQA